MGARGAATGRAIQEELRWMVFKVKQKAKTNYESMLLKNTGQDIGLSLAFGPDVVDDPKYSYNWPYDYFSMFEFANIEADIEFSDTPAVPNLDYLPEPTDAQLEEGDGA